MAAKGLTRFSNPSPAIPLTPESAAPPRRSLRTATATASDHPTPVVPTSVASRTPKSVSKRSLLHPDAPIVTPDQKKQRRSGTPSRTPQKRDVSSLSPVTPDSKQQRRSGPSSRTAERRVFYKKVVFDGVVFEVGDYVYLKRREGPESDDDEPEVEECRICFREGGTVMIECDDCLGGFHLKCLKPPLRKVPEGDWICSFCEARKLGKDVQLPSPPKGKMVRRTAKEKLLSSDLWAVRIERYYSTHLNLW